MTDHLSEEQATYFAYDLMDAAERRTTSAHVAECPECTSRVHRFEAEREEVRDALDRTAPPPSLERRVIDAVRTSPPRWRFFLPAAVLAAAFLVAIGVSMTAGPVGRIERGRFEARTGQGASLRTGESLRTQDEAELSLADGTRMVLGPGTSVVFDGRRGDAAVLRLIRGSVRCRVAPGPRAFSVDTEAGRVTDIGTEFIVESWVEGGTKIMKNATLGAMVVVSVAVITGAVIWKNRNGELRMRAGESATATAGTAPTALSPKDAHALKLEVDRLKAEIATERARAETAEAALQKLTARDPKAAVKAKPGPDDWKTRKDAEFEARVRAVPWKKVVKSLVGYFHEMDLAVKEGRNPDVSAFYKDLTILQTEVMGLAKELGVEKDFWKAYSNPVVGRYFAENYIQALAGSDLTAAQIEKLSSSPIFEQDDTDVTAQSGIAGWKHQMEWNSKVAAGTRDILTPEQYASLTGTLHSAFMIDGYKERTVGDAAGVAQYWTERLKIPAASAETLGSIASDYSREYQQLVNQYAGQYGATLPRDREIELEVKLLDLQIAAEKKIAEVVPMDDAQRKNALGGSGAVIRIAVK